MTKILVNLYMEVSIKERRSRAPLSPIKHNQWYEVTASAASDWLRDISGWKWLPLISLNQSEAGLAVTS